MTTAITTERLVLRPHSQADAAELVRGLNNFNVSRWTSRVPFPYGLADAEAFLALEVDGACRWAVARKDNPDRLIGGIGYEIRAPHTVPEIGYWIAEPFWRNGYGREAARAAVNDAFSAGAHTQMLARCDPGNDGSRRILLGLGFEPRGIDSIFSRANGRDVEVECLTLERSQFTATRDRGR